jgi:hypothetical protein
VIGALINPTFEDFDLQADAPTSLNQRGATERGPRCGQMSGRLPYKLSAQVVQLETALSKRCLACLIAHFTFILRIPVETDCMATQESERDVFEMSP